LLPRWYIGQTRTDRHRPWEGTSLSVTLQRSKVNGYKTWKIKGKYVCQLLLEGYKKKL
jgi:hypothetical protein